MQTQNPLVAPSIPSGQEIYDRIMGTIEPELLSQELPLLTDKYADETADAKKRRLARYARAFSAYDDAYGAFAADTSQKVHAYRSQAFALEESNDHRRDKGVLQKLESSFV